MQLDLSYPHNTCTKKWGLDKKKINVTYTRNVEDPLFNLNFSIGIDKGFIHCDGCGQRLRTCFAKGKTGKLYPYYYCKNNNCTLTKKSINKTEFDILFEKFLKNMKPKEEFVELFTVQMVEKWQQDHEDVEKRRKEASDERESLNIISSNLIKMRSNNEITKVEFTDQIEQIRIKIAALTSIIVETTITRNQLECMLEEAKLMINNLEYVYRDLSPINRQIFITKLFPQGILYKNGKLRTLQKCEWFEYIDVLEAQKRGLVLDGDPKANPLEHYRSYFGIL